MTKQHEKRPDDNKKSEPSNKDKFRRIDTDHDEPSWRDETKKGPHAYEGPIKEQV